MEARTAGILEMHASGREAARRSDSGDEVEIFNGREDASG